MPPAYGHDYIAVVTPPTCVDEGYTTYTCSRCGDEYIEDYVPAIGHRHVTDVAVTFTEPSRQALDDGTYFWSGTLGITLTLSDGTIWEKTWGNMGKINTIPEIADWAVNSWWFSSDDLAFGLDIDICKVVTVYYRTVYTYVDGITEVTLDDVSFENGDYICGD